jgi:predicted PurR-regulated permease PerM
MFLLIGALTIGLLAVLAPLLISQISALTTELPKYYTSFREWLTTTTIPLTRSFAYQLPPDFPLSATPAPAQSGEQVNAVGQAVSIVRSLGWSAFGLVAITLITFFWIVDREQIVRAGLLVVPIDQREGAREIWDILEEKVGAFVRGQALLCVSIGVLSGAAFLAIGLPNALLLAVLAGILEAIPYLGPIATALLAISLTLAQSPENIWWVVGACIIIQQIENAILVPRIMDRAVGVNAVVTLLAIAAFGSLLGVGGAIMAIPLAVIIQVILERLLLNTPQQPAEQITGRDHVSLLRYQAHDLASDLRERIKDYDELDEQDILEEDIEAVVGEIDDLLHSISTSNADVGATVRG